MCDFPSWRACRDGSILFLTDKDVAMTKWKFKDSCGHTAITNFFKETNGIDLEGLKNCPPSFLKAIRAGKCQKMMANAEIIDFSDATVKGITFPKRIKGDLHLRDSVLISTVLPEYVAATVNLRRAKFRNTILPKSVGFSIEFYESDLRKVVLPQKVGHCANFYDCNLSGVTFPAYVGVQIHIHKCNLKGARILQRRGNIYLYKCKNIPQEFYEKKWIDIEGAL